MMQGSFIPWYACATLHLLVVGVGLDREFAVPQCVTVTPAGRPVVGGVLRGRPLGELVGHHRRSQARGTRLQGAVPPQRP